MFEFPIKYEGRIYRPPSEAQSLLLQVTVGCSNNKCTYCAMYRDKTYTERSTKDLFNEIEKAHSFFTQVGQFPNKVFLCDGDALGAPMDLLIPVLDKINEHFPNIKRISTYATADNILNKSVEDLQLLTHKKLNMAYLGMESGDDQVLKLVTKRNSAKDMIDAGVKIRSAGFKLSVIAMLGLGGKKLTESHCENTALAISKIAPEFFSFLTTTPIPGTPYARMVDRESWQMLSDKELLTEMRDIISNIKLDNERIIFRANHVSNLHPLAGVIPKDSDKILKQLSQWITQCPEDRFTRADPESL